MKLADELLSKCESKAVVDEKKNEAEKKDMEMIKELKDEKYHESNDMQKKMVEKMMKLATSESDASNKFMKHMDEAASVYGMSDSQQREKEIKAKADKDSKIPAKKL